ncbi:MbtH family protein [Kitasatospora sp. NPDC127067]|uniref:MbtH family protein n=1 Tax=Kitasatospora sp. NPDC127067 TaxID=3347126 RepID=UPI003651454D
MADDVTYQVTVNDEEQYSIWPADQDLPLGWKAEGKTGSKEECMAHIREVWTDMRPLSLRRAMGEAAK